MEVFGSAEQNIDIYFVDVLVFVAIPLFLNKSTRINSGVFERRGDVHG
jgi:hypothetical protein